MKNNIVTAEMIVKDTKIGVMRVGNANYISLTDLAKYANSKDPSGVIRNWMSNKNSFDYYSLWEQLNNVSFNSVESHRIKVDEVGYNRFTMTPKRWKNEFNAIGIIPSSGKYSKGTYAHPDIAFEFASWLSPEFKLYLIREFERLKINEAYQEKIDWQANRLLSKLNYIVHTDAIKNYIVPALTEEQKKFVYAEEADVLNVALFGQTAREWRSEHSNLKGNIRDYTDLLHLVILNNLQNANAQLIEMKKNQQERLVELNNMARRQMKILRENNNIKEIEKLQQQVNDGSLMIDTSINKKE